MLPQSIVTVSLVTALLPRMSRAVTEHRVDDLRADLSRALRISGINVALATACHFLLSPRWAVTGMAAAYALSYAVGLLLTALRLRRRTEGLLDGRRICRTYAKLTTAATAAGSAGWLIARSCSQSLTSVSWTPALSLAAGGTAMVLLFLLLARLLRIQELRSLPGLG